MVIKSIQKVIKVGDSLAVTIPAKEAKYNNVKVGEMLEMNLKRPDTVDQQNIQVVELTQKLIARHKKALKNLSQR
jgi:antitoxin component of MazEF toxin-antitoxin module